MSLTVSNTALDVPGGVRMAIASITFDSSYPAGGEALSASDFGMDVIDAVLPLGPTTAGRIVRPTDNNSALKVFNPNSGVNLKTYKIAGGSAGNLTVTGIATADRLLSVLRLNRDATAANVDIADLTAEFAICAADTVGNAAGTDTTGDSLYFITADASAAQSGPFEVPDTTNLATEVVKVLVIGKSY